MFDFLWTWQGYLYGLSCTAAGYVLGNLKPWPSAKKDGATQGAESAKDFLERKFLEKASKLGDGST